MVERGLMLERSTDACGFRGMVSAGGDCCWYSGGGCCLGDGVLEIGADVRDSEAGDASGGDGCGAEALDVDAWARLGCHALYTFGCAGGGVITVSNMAAIPAASNVVDALAGCRSPPSSTPPPHRRRNRQHHRPRLKQRTRKPHPRPSHIPLGTGPPPRTAHHLPQHPHTHPLSLTFASLSRLPICGLSCGLRERNSRATTSRYPWFGIRKGHIKKLGEGRCIL